MCFYLIKLELSYIILFGPPFDTTKMEENNGTNASMMNVKIKNLDFEISSSVLFKLSFLLLFYYFVVLFFIFEIIPTLNKNKILVNLFRNF